jgi:DNA-binding NarL/FixJ family response regulator
MIGRKEKRHRVEVPDGRTGESSPTPPYRVLVVEDFAPIRREICFTLASDPRLQVIGEAADGMEAVQMAAELKPDLISLDIGLPKLDGLQAAQRILASAPQTRIVFVSQESSPEVIEEALKLGQSFVPKRRIVTQLLTAVNAVISDVAFDPLMLNATMPYTFLGDNSSD